MNLLASLFTESPAPLPKKARKVVAPEMRSNGGPIPRRDTDYGTVQPRILDHLKTVPHATSKELSVALGINTDSVRRAIRSLKCQDKIKCVSEFGRGKNYFAKWKLVQGKS